MNKSTAIVNVSFARVQWQLPVIHPELIGRVAHRHQENVGNLLPLDSDIWLQRLISHSNLVRIPQRLS